MTKSVKKIVVDTATVAGAIVADQDALALSTPQQPQAPESLELTFETISARVSDGVAQLISAFTQMEQRTLGDNGKLYPLDVQLPPEVQDTGSIQLVNRFRFLATSVAGAVCWKLESMLDQADDRIESMKSDIAKMVRQLGTGRVDEAIIERRADFLEQLIAQRQMLVVAFGAARDAYDSETGEEFETKAMRADRQREVAKAQPTGLSDRLASLGIKG
jgi:hypothetical protein